MQRVEKSPDLPNWDDLEKACTRHINLLDEHDRSILFPKMIPLRANLINQGDVGPANMIN